jgi:hypothetical protein
MTRHQRTRARLALLFPVAWLSQVAPARADDACAAAYEESQVARSEGRLRAAQRELGACTRAECAEFIRVDCARWLGEVEAAQPTIVLRATDGDQDVTDVSVDLDGEPLATQLEGKAVAVEPGRHVLTLRRADLPPVQVTLIFREGEKNRPVSVALRAPKRVAAQPVRAAVPAAHGAGPWPWVLLGVGAAGAAGFGVFGALGAEQRQELERTCSPRCEEERIDAVRSKFLLADVSAAVGLLAIAGSGYLFWTAARDEPATASLARPRAAGLAFTGEAVSAAARWSF